MKAESISYKSLENCDVFLLMESARQGIDYKTFDELSEKFPLKMSEWSRILNVSERTMQRYKREQRRFDPIHSERLILIGLLFKKGTEVFGTINDFLTWLFTENVSLGGASPSEFLDNSFGLALVKDELIRIEHGVLA
ncbi:MAG: DUF2384 domain-containing protein [Bacteroidetes bacterium]|nr:DUF2384 domain-containing protein [Bacteroidota bacterium]